MSSSREREANKTAHVDIVAVAKLMNADGATPKSAMKDVFPFIIRIACMCLDGLESVNYVEDFIQLLKRLKKKREKWEDLILSFLEWIVYPVAKTKTGKVRMAKDEFSTRMLMLAIIENNALFMEDCDIPFEINKCFFTTPLYLLALQNKVHLCDHLCSVVKRELVGMQPALLAAGAEGIGSSRVIAQVNYKAPRGLYILGEPWLLQAKDIVGAIIGRLAHC